MWLHVSHSTVPVQQAQTLACRFSWQLTREYPRITRYASEHIDTELWVTLNDHIFNRTAKLAYGTNFTWLLQGQEDSTMNVKFHHPWGRGSCTWMWPYLSYTGSENVFFFSLFHDSGHNWVPVPVYVCNELERFYQKLLTSWPCGSVSFRYGLVIY